jgi:hypothetical protein
MGSDPDFFPVVGDIVTLGDEPDCIIPAGDYKVSHVNPDGSFRVSGNTSVWPRRIIARYHTYR